MFGYNSAQRICSEVTGYNQEKKKNMKSAAHMSKLLQGTSFRRGAWPPFLCGDRVWKFFVFLLFLIKQWNNSSCAPLT